MAEQPLLPDMPEAERPLDVSSGFGPLLQNRDVTPACSGPGELHAMGCCGVRIHVNRKSCM